MQRKVRFSGPIDQAAAGDVINYYGGPSQSDPEWAIQKAFKKATGITCRREAREWLTDLMQVHGFTGRELGNAWRWGSLGWNKQQNTPKVTISRAEPYFAWGTVAVISLIFAVVASIFIVGPAAGQRYAQSIVEAIALTYLGVLWIIRTILMDPRSVALRVREVMQSGATETGSGEALANG